MLGAPSEVIASDDLSAASLIWTSRYNTSFVTPTFPKKNKTASTLPASAPNAMIAATNRVSPKSNLSNCDVEPLRDAIGFSLEKLMPDRPMYHSLRPRDGAGPRRARVIAVRAYGTVS
jgi:hypothetical protein